MDSKSSLFQKFKPPLRSANSSQETANQKDLSLKQA